MPGESFNNGDDMKLTKFLRTGLVVIGTAFALFAAQPKPQQDTTPAPRVINIAAKRYTFTPNQITLKKGETVTLRLTSEDRVHGFYLKPLKIDEVIEPGKTTDVTITPTETGTFTIICDHFCGAGHGSMNMTVVVE